MVGYGEDITREKQIKSQILYDVGVKLAIVIPIYNEQENLSALSQSIAQACDDIDDLDWQVIYINDGSTDDSLRMIGEQIDRDTRFSVVELSRNFGHAAAVSAGLAHVKADAAVIMDGDLQDPPWVIVQLVAMFRQGAQVVVAHRTSSAETGIRGLGMRIFHRVFHLISDFPIQPNAGVFCLLGRDAIEQFNRLPERHRYLPALRSWIGFDQRVIHYDRDSRNAGKPKQTMRRLISMALDGVISFSFKPLRFMTICGVMTSVLGFALACHFAIKRLMGIETAEIGFTTLVTLILFLGGIQLIGLGLLGEYLGRIYDEVKQRPLYIVKNRIGVDDPADQS